MTDKILIHLEESSDARRFSEENLIHRSEYNQVKMWIGDQIKRAVSEPQNKSSTVIRKDYFHNAISILGTRGSGKTSFLLSLLSDYEKHDDACVLGIIDPTLIEEKGHVFLNVISLIKDKVDDKLGNDNSNPKSPAFRQKKEWYDKLELLAHGLPSIDGVGSGLNEAYWQDAEYIMNKGLRAINAAQDLRDNFNELLEHSLRILGKKAFIIAFDDIDIDFNKGWPVLESIRKYFTSNTLVTLVSGDLRLYSLAIKKNQLSNIGAERQFESDVESQVRSLVTEMQGQYLQKIMKPERRIHLLTLYEKLVLKEEDELSIRIAAARPVPIINYYNYALKRFGIRNVYQAEAYRTFLLSLPVRTQIQFMLELERTKADWSRANVLDAFASDLFEKQVDVGLVGSTPKLVIITILKLLLREKLLGEAYQLQPITSDHSMNSCLIALSFLFSSHVHKKNPHLIFDYFIKIGYTRNLLGAFDYRNPDSPIGVAPSIEGLCRHSEIFQDKVLRDVAGLMTSYIRGTLNNTGSYAGTIPLLGLGQVSKQSADIITNRIDVVFEKEPSVKRMIGYFPVTVCKYAGKQQTLVVYSVYTLLATVGELIRKHKDSDNDLFQGFLELSQIRIYAMPDFERYGAEATGVSTFRDQAESESQLNRDRPKLLLSSFNMMIKDWIERFPRIAISPHLLGKISTRFFYAIENIDERDASNNLGEAMHRRIVAFLNAVLIEDVKENASEYRDLNINNTVSSDRIFVDNLKKVQAGKSTEGLYVTRWLLSCPLLLAYLKPGLIKQSLSWITRGSNMSQFSVFDNLSRVSLKEDTAEADQTPLKHIKTHKQLVEYLRKSDIPYRYFEDHDRLTQIHFNAMIVSRLGAFFGKGEKARGKIWRFRKYLKDNGIRW